MLESIFSPVGTKIFLVAIFSLLVIWGCLALIIGGEESTISRVAITSCKNHIVIAVIIGIIIGHIFWPN